MAAVLLISFLVLMIIGVPISFSMGLSTLLAIVYEGIPIEVFPQRAFSGIDSFPMMAIPFFILAAAARPWPTRRAPAPSRWT